MAKLRSLLFAGSAICCVAKAQVTWEITNRFPLLSDAAFAAVSTAVGSDPVEVEARLTQVDFRNRVKHLEGTAWNEQTAKYDAVRLLSDKAEIAARTRMGVGECNWTLMKVSGEVAFSKSSSCETSPPIAVVLGESYELRAIRSSDGHSVSTAVKPLKHFIIALGDSFTSGEGNPDYPAVFKAKYSSQPPHDWAVDKKYPVAGLKLMSAQWLGTDCHRSLLSWPTLYALRQALAKTDTVVQFASFACSGAEVIDGFLLPQRNPPGRIGTKMGGKDWFLEASQQLQLARLLCDGQTLRSEKLALDDDLHLYLEKYGNVDANAELWKCARPTKPNEVLVQFGGNDTSFSGVVKYVFQPQQLDYRGGPLGWFLGSGINFGLYKALTPVKPAVAVTYAEKLPKLYSLLNRGLRELGIDAPRVSVRMVLYPDPVASMTVQADQAAELRSCNLRTRDGNRPMQSLIASGLSIFKHDSALAGANSDRLIEARDIYVLPLRKTQRAAAESQSWQLTDSQPAITGYGLCAGSLECERLGDDCPNADRVRWAFWRRDSQYVYARNTPPWEQMSHFLPYDPLRKRGMRYANDALLTSARLTDDLSGLRLDWVAGIAHPTAAVHARIAALLTGRPSPEPGR